MRLHPMIMLAATGLLLSTALAGCARPHADPLPPPPPAAIVIKDTPPAELLACPAPPAGFPEDQAATMTPEIRAAMIRVVTWAGSIADQLGRLIQWQTPGACGVKP